VERLRSADKSAQTKAVTSYRTPKLPHSKGTAFKATALQSLRLSLTFAFTAAGAMTLPTCLDRWFILALLF
jgi:hypothetical protein